MSLEVALTHRFGGVGGDGATLDVRFVVPSAGVTVLFGPSGAGKSTVVAVLAGVLRPDRCRVVVDGMVLADTGGGAGGVWLAPERRRVGLVFQEARLFPHMSVDTNLRYGARRAPAGPVRFDDVVALLGLSGLLQRRPGTLSGGERQRVAIGRALLAQPRLLLMDEPLASLDAARKAEIIPYLLRLQAVAPVPTVYVTHAMDEVVALASNLVLLEAGRVVAAGPVGALSAQAGLPMARRADAAAVLDLAVAEHEVARGLTRLEGAGVALLVPLLSQGVGAPVRVRIAAREVILAGPAVTAMAGQLSLHNVLAGVVRAVVAIDGSVQVEVAVGEAALLARVTGDAVARLGLVPGRAVLALVKSVAVEVVRGG